MLTLFHYFFESSFNTFRKNIREGLPVLITLKKDQRTDILTYGIVESILTSKINHTRGIKVRLLDQQVGRVQYVLNSLLKEITLDSSNKEILDHLNTSSFITIIKPLNEVKDLNTHDIILLNNNIFAQILSIKTYKSSTDYKFELSNDLKEKYKNSSFCLITLEKIGISR